MAETDASRPVSLGETGCSLGLPDEWPEKPEDGVVEVEAEDVDSAEIDLGPRFEAIWAKAGDGAGEAVVGEEAVVDEGCDDSGLLGGAGATIRAKEIDLRIPLSTTVLWAGASFSAVGDVAAASVCSAAAGALLLG